MTEERESAAGQESTAPEPAGAGQAAPQAEGWPPGTAGPPGSRAETVGLLVKALGMLPGEERDQVYRWLLSRGLAGSWGPERLPGLNAQLLALQTAGSPAGSPPMGQQVVPVRFAADQHAQLRAWCAEHGFSMATVIRGLVARFLEGQLPPRS